MFGTPVFSDITLAARRTEKSSEHGWHALELEWADTNAAPEVRRPADPTI